METLIQTQIFYEIAMSIGNSRDLGSMLKEGLPAYLRKLNCSAGIVYEMRKEAGGALCFRPVLSIPRNLSLPACQAVQERIPHHLSQACLAEFLQTLPFSGQDDKGRLCHLMELPGFGLMLLVSSSALSPDIIRSLGPLNRKLADSCLACLQNMKIEAINQQLTHEISERKQAEEELRKSRDELELGVRERTAELEKANEELWQIPSKLIAVLEEERKRLASELHDSIGQTLAAVKFWVEMALKLRGAGEGNAALNHLEQFVPILQRSIEETRNIYMGLRPSMLDSHGLLATLEWQRQECMKLYPERHIELESTVTEEEIPKNLKVNIFRIVQEALNNVAKHSKAEWVDISLSKNGVGIELVVSDDGVGMDLDIIMRTSTATSFGLTSMRERAELTGGSFSIESTLGEGSTIRTCWPIGD